MHFFLSETVESRRAAEKKSRRINVFNSFNRHFNTEEIVNLKKYMQIEFT